MIDFDTHVDLLANSDGFKNMNSRKMHLVHACLGISGETGELVDAIKKHVAYGQDLDLENVIEEVGDLMFYIQLICNTLSISIDGCLSYNKNKLKKRYPDGFTKEHAELRLDKASELTQVPVLTQVPAGLAQSASNYLKDTIGEEAKREQSDGTYASYYDIPDSATKIGDLIDHKAMSFNVGTIFKSTYRLGESSHSDAIRDLNKIKYAVEAELKRLGAD